MLTKILYCFKAAFQNIKNNLLVNLITITTIAITFIIFTAFLLMVMNLNAFKSRWADQLQIIVYFDNGASSDTISTTRSRISAYDQVEAIKFVSGEDALKMLRKSLQGQDGLLEGLTESPLPPSLDIKLKKEFLSVEGVEAVVAKIKGLPFVQDIEYGQKWLDRFMTFFAVLRIIGFSLGGFLFIFTLFIISNTIKLMVYNRREEIEIMKLVGASHRFIKLPFFLEGAFQGFTGAGCALLCVSAVSNIIVSQFLSDMHIYADPGNFVVPDVTLCLSVFLLGGILGFTGSYLSLNSLRELKH